MCSIPNNCESDPTLRNSETTVPCDYELSNTDKMVARFNSYPGLIEERKLKEFATCCRGFAEDEVELLVKKQRDYGPHNIAEMGEAGLLVRLNDKMARLKNLCMGDTEPEFETMEDTLIDISNYARIWRMGLEGLWPVPFTHIKLTLKVE